MIKLKSLLTEFDNKQPDKSLNNFLLENNTVYLSEWVYHGTPLTGLKDMLIHGINGQSHGEVAENNAFSTSLNSEVIHLFSEGDGETGFQFKVVNTKLIVLDDIVSFLVTQLPGSGLDVEVDENELNTFVKKFNIPISKFRETPYLPYDYLSSIGIDAFVFEYTWKRFQKGRNYTHNDESEICFIGNGIEKLNNSITNIYVYDTEYDVADKQLALDDIESRL